MSIPLLLHILDQAFDKKAWHGPTLRGVLRGMSAEEAAWRPSPGRHNIHDFVYHTAYWKYIVRRIVSGNTQGKFPRSPANWPKASAAIDAKSWAADLRMLEAEHQKLRAAVESFNPRYLQAKTSRGVWTHAELIHGVAAHDLYHAGQIQLTRKLYAESGAVPKRGRKK